MTITIAEGFSTQQKVEILGAGYAWDGITESRFTFVRDGEWLINPATSIEYLGVDRFGLETDSSRLVQVRTDLPDVLFFAVTLHELGHVLGLHHVDGGVMDPGEPSTEFTSGDTHECRRVDACN